MIFTRLPICRFLNHINCLIACVVLTVGFAQAEDKPRQLERIRTFDVQHIKAELELFPPQAKLEGVVTHTIKPLFDGLTEVGLDCEELEISDVKINGQSVDVNKWSLVARHPNRGKPGTQDAKDMLKIKLNQVYRRSDTLQVSIHYSGKPTRGMYFIRPDEFYPNKPLCIWTQGEPEQNHFWLPCYDYPNEMASSEMVVTVPQELFVLSNGVLVETKTDEKKKTKTYHWKMEQPHVSYLISLVVADLQAFEMEYEGLPIISYAPRSMYNEAQMRRAFGRTHEMLKLFNRLTGVDYPWPKYSQAMVPEFRAGGMENISATTLTEFTTRDDGAALESTADGLVAHELAHQWWGDLLTCKDWSHLWLNEGFATYFDALFTEYDLGADAFAFKVDSNRKSAINVDEKNPRPMVWDRYEKPFEMFDARAYPKGASVLHMLRGLLGDKAFFNGMAEYARKYRHQPVETDDLRKSLEKTSGKKLDWFFDQWCYKAGAPKLEVSWRWNEEDSTARVSVKQSQKTSDLVPLFRLPTVVEFVGMQQVRRVPVTFDRAEQELIVPLDERPERVQIDPERFLLAEIHFKLSADELRTQLRRDPHVIHRAAAATALGEMSADEANLAALAESMKKEKSEYMRREIVQAWGKFKGNAEAKQQLIAALKDKHAVVRRAAAEQMEHLEGAEVLVALREAWNAEPAPQTRVALLRMLNKKDASGTESLLEQALDQASYRQALATTALELLAASKHPAKRNLILLRSQRGMDELIRVGAVSALGKMAQEDSTLVAQVRHLADDDTYFVRRRAIDVLGDIGGKEDADYLQRLLRKPADKRELDSIEKAAEKISKRLSENPTKQAEQKAKQLDRQVEQLQLQMEQLQLEARKIRSTLPSATVPAPTPAEK